MTSPLNYKGGRQFPQSILDDLDSRLKGLEAGKEAGWLHVDEVKQLCQDFSSREGSVYIKDVESALDGLAAIPLASIVPTVDAKPDFAALVNRFLAWPLPASVACDGCCVDATYKFPRSGANLLSGVEAEAMFRHVLAQPSAAKEHQP